MRGDIVALSEGERIPADAIIREGEAVEIDESLLTGESVPVGKRASLDVMSMGAPGGEDTPLAFSGALMVRGRALAEVAATGEAPSWDALAAACSLSMTRPVA